MIRFKKRNRAVSPVIATVILISLVLAGTAIVLLVVMPMLNTGPEPNLVLLNENSFKDYDNDGLCDYMSLQIQNVIGGTNANITGVSVIWVDGEEAKDVKWEPLNEKDSLITEGSMQMVEFIASFDDLSEVASGAEIAILIISSESSHTLLEVTNPILVTTGEKVIVTFEDGSEVPIAGANIDFYKATGEYAYSGEPTNSIGRSESYLFPGHYKARASKDFAFHYSAEFTHPDNIGPIKIKVVGGTMTVKVKSGDTPIEGAITYVYDTFGHYLSKNSATNSDGICTFSLDNGNYKFRADVSGITYYSEDVTFPDQTYVEIDTGGGDIYCRVIDGGDNPIPNVRVYLFRASGSYFGRYANTNTTGLAFFPNVPGATLFKFRVDYLAYRLWSQEFGASHGSVIDVNVGGGTIYVNVTDGSGFPIQNTRTYLFTESGSYSGKWSNTNDTGIATYERVAAGWFKIRIDYLAQRFWSPVFNATDGEVIQASIGGGTLYGNITSAGKPIVNVRVYLFTESGSYTGKYGNTNASGMVEIQGVGTSNYRMRVDYQARRFWSPVFYFDQTEVVSYDIGGGTVYANVTSGGTPIIGVRVYAFTPSGSYTGSYANTNASGIAEFATLGGGDYKFRVDYLARRFWSDVFTTADGLVVDVDLGGGTVNVHLFNEYNVNLTNVRIYLFTDTGSYTGKYANTDGDGIAVFTGVGEADFKFRADYLAKRYWSSVFTASPDLNVDFNIGGGIVYLHVFDGNGTDIDGPRAYLFTSTGSYTGYYADLSSGYISCPRIGDGTFKWRVDYLAKRFWSPEFDAINGTTLEFNIGGGTIQVHLTVDGVDVNNGRVYLFTSTGSYTGISVLTDANGLATFEGIGAGDYRFRYSHSGSYYWQNFTASAGLDVEFAIVTVFMFNMITADAPSTRKLFIPSLFY